MKISAAIATAALAAGATAFDKYLPWGKRDYSCVNVYQGVPDNSTVAPGTTIDIRFNRAPTTNCEDPLAQYPGDYYSVWLYNNPVRNLDTINYDHQVKLTDGFSEKDGKVSITIPEDLPTVDDESVWYLRLSGSLSTAPQMPTIYNAAGPFTIQKQE
ncbi:uncharacterized protein ASPGLDRAFT_69435 [Aspergillus glaucus CBS 516.65]|uniref:Uncharacterized protein n=1 Tax=Aspergillus glaucus CBS 516.65 TaxID=1160497 RepID=A0A1L9V8S0_ASPGL|nr:hypothetical protein ASPGLDRAFT_69435 [Aspergillus glaucus CBS 516.65]OJJ80334.1 hypothetical protein ASPGLDRAFT_69435 [Aspergillus glaucus CBS 516.65]